MALTTSEMTPADFAAVTGNNNGWGNDGGWWLILLFLFAFNGWGGGFNSGNGGGFVGADMQRGFDQQATMGAINGVQCSVNNGFANAEVSACNRAMDAMQTAYGNQIASMNQNFANQQALDNRLFGIDTSLQNCCCENRANIADLKYTVATENCADRNAISDALRNVIESNTANTQRILDQLCNDKIDAKNDTIAQLRQELLYARGQASQDVQTAVLRQGQEAEVDALYNRLNNCPVGTVPVYGRQPIFTCGGDNNGCGCGM